MGKIFFAILSLILLLAAVAAMSGCATVPEDRQADWDKACKYSTGVLAAAGPFIPTIKGLLLARFGQDGSLVLDAAVVAINSACQAPLDVNSNPQIIQRVWDAGGEIVALVVKAQGPVQ